jgi:hypothetical protein
VTARALATALAISGLGVSLIPSPTGATPPDPEPASAMALDEFTDRRVGAGVNTRTGGDLGDQCGQGGLGLLARALHGPADGPADVAVPTLHRVAASRDAQRRRYAS